MRKYAGLMLKFGGVTVILIGCASLGGLPTAEQLKESGVLKPDADLAALSRGRSIMQANCGKCHDRPDPDEKTPAEWPAILRKMTENAGLTADQKKDIELYILTVSKAAQGK